METAAAISANVKSHVFVIVGTGLCAISCGAIFLLALYQQFGLVEVAASLSAWVEVYFLSSAIGDLLEHGQQPNRGKFIGAVCLAVAIALYFVVMRLASVRSA